MATVIQTVKAIMNIIRVIMPIIITVITDQMTIAIQTMQMIAMIGIV